MKNFIAIFMFILLLQGCTSDQSNDLSSVEKQGDDAFARREYQAATDLWLKVDAKDEKHTAIMLKISDAYFRLGKLEKAEIFLKKAEKADPDNVKIKLILAKINILLWRLSEAEQICRFLDDKKSEDPELELIKADISLMSNDLLKAEKHYKKAIIDSSDSLRALMKYAVFLKSSERDQEAQQTFQIVQKSSVIPSSIYLLIADYYLLDHIYEKAEEAVLEAIRIEPEDISLKYYLAKLYLSWEDSKKAEQLLESLSVNQGDLYHKLMIADVYILNNKLDKAEKVISELKERISEPLAEFELLQGKFWLYSGKPVYATAHIKTAVDIKPGLMNAHYLLGLVYMISGKTKLAENSLTKTLQISPDYYRALLLISELLYKKEDYDLSLKYLERLLGKYPEDFTGRTIKGLNLMGLGKYDEAKKEFEKSLWLNKNKVHISMYYLGLIEEKTGNPVAAIQYYQKVLATNPDLTETAFRYCMMLLKTNQNRSAVDFIRKRMSEREMTAEENYLAGKVFISAGNKSEAETYFKKAVGFEDASGYMFLELAEYYSETGRIEKSIEILNQCITKMPDYPDARVRLSSLYMDRFEMSAALEVMRKGEERFEALPHFQSNLAFLLLENNEEIDKALDIAKAAYEKEPNNMAIADTLGWAYYHKGIYSQSVWLLSDAHKKNPENGFIQFHLGMTYYQQGEIEKAVKYLKMAGKSKESRFFAHNADELLSRLSSTKPDHPKEGQAQKLNESILAPPEMQKDDQILSPQWKQ